MSDAVKKHNNIISYERKRKKMGNTSSQSTSKQTTSGTGGTDTHTASANSKGNTPGAPDGGSENSEGHISKRIKEILAILGALVGIVIIAIKASWNLSEKFASQGKDIEILQNDLSDIKNEILEIKDSISEVSNTVSGLNLSVKEDHETFLQLASKGTGEKVYSVVFKDDYQVKVETIANEEYLATPLWGEGDNGIAQDADSERIYSPEDLYNTPIITSYMKDGKEVYFYGRFDENNRWNGKCILNTYSGDKLVSIYEGIYDKGTLYSYKRVEDKGDYWLVNDRVYQGEYNSGETWKYVKTDDFVKSFSVKDVKEKQIMTVDDFLKSKEPELLSYYRGNTANGLYNDNTGSAYLVSYFEDGELQGAENQEVIRTLYCGNFKDGVYNDDTGNAYLISYFENGELPGTEGQEVIKTFYQGHFKNDVYDDDTGNAWYITRQVDTKYMYYKGSFSRGNVDHIIETDRGRDVGYDYILDKLEKNGFGKYITQFWIEY